VVYDVHSLEDHLVVLQMSIGVKTVDLGDKCLEAGS